MTIEISPDHQQFIHEALSRGQFRTVDELLTHAFDRLREEPGATVPDQNESFAQFLRRSPIFGSGVCIDERDSDPGREVSL